MAKKTRVYCPQCRQKSIHECRTVDGQEIQVCLLCELLEQQLGSAIKPDQMNKNTSSTTDPKDVYEFLRSWGGPFGGGLAGG